MKQFGQSAQLTCELIVELIGESMFRTAILPRPVTPAKILPRPVTPAKTHSLDTKSAASRRFTCVSSYEKRSASISRG
jgi:hypothetical protein